MVALLSFLLTDEQFLAWGWRIAFLLSGVMVLVGMYIRLRIQETPEFAAVKARNAELRIPFMDMCRRRSKSEPPCRPNIEPGVGAGLQRAGGG